MSGTHGAGHQPTTTKVHLPYQNDPNLPCFQLGNMQSAMLGSVFKNFMLIKEVPKPVIAGAGSEQSIEQSKKMLDESYQSVVPGYSQGTQSVADSSFSLQRLQIDDDDESKHSEEKESEEGQEQQEEDNSEEDDDCEELSIIVENLDRRQILKLSQRRADTEIRKEILERIEENIVDVHFSETDMQPTIFKGLSLKLADNKYLLVSQYAPKLCSNLEDKAVALETLKTAFANEDFCTDDLEYFA